MNDEESEAKQSRSYPADRLFNLLDRDPYKALGIIWEKAIDRIDDDPSGAITSAKALLEAACKIVLDRTSVKVKSGADLPQLYAAASKALDISPGAQTDQTYRSIFGSVHTVLQGVGELRNRAGDAHGNHTERFTTSISEAELAVNLTGSIVLFLLSTLESYLTLTKRIGSDGRIILRFEKSTTWRLVDHARNSPQSEKFYGEDTGPALWLVGDTGVYLMSNGSPRINSDGLLIELGKEKGQQSLVIYADGCDPTLDEFERWWSIHGAIDKGSDFSIPVPIETILQVLPSADSGIVFIVGEEEYHVYPDIEFKRVFGAKAW